MLALIYMVSTKAPCPWPQQHLSGAVTHIRAAFREEFIGNQQDMKWGIMALNLAFIIMASYFAVGLFYKTATSRMAPLVSQPQRVSGRAENAGGAAAFPPLSHYDHIRRRNLFRTPAAPSSKPPAPPPPADVEKMADTSLNIRLWGTVTGDSASSYAVIEQPKKRRHKLYAVGDAVQDAVIKRILRDKVVLAVNGRDEVLKMEKFSGRRRVIRRSSPSVGSAGRPRTAPRRRVTLSRDRLEQAAGNLGELMKQARFRPYFRNGKPYGIRVSRVRRNSVFREMGLRSGDVITGVDDVPVRSVDDALRFYSDLKTASRAVIQIQRRGRPQAIEYAIE